MCGIVAYYMFVKPTTSTPPACVRRISPPYDVSNTTSLQALSYGKMGSHKHVIDKEFTAF